MHGMAKHRRKGRFERARAVEVEHHIGDPEIFGELELAPLRRESALAPIKLEPAGAAEISLGAGFGAQRVVLGDRARHERTHEPSGFSEPRRLGGRVKCRQPRRDLRQKREMIVGLGRALERDPQAFPPIGGKCRRKHRIALDHTGIAIGGPLPRPTTVDQGNRQAALGEVNGDRGANDPGPKDNDIGARHGTSAVTAFPKTLPQPRPSRQGSQMAVCQAPDALLGRE
jgi:hypothetical protein